MLNYCLLIDYLLVIDDEMNPVQVLRTNFSKLNLKIDAFSSLDYHGQKVSIGDVSFELIKSQVDNFLSNNHIRSPRRIEFIIKMLKVSSFNI